MNLPAVVASTGMPAIAVGQRIGKYRIVRLLGAGGMGAVYEVQQPEIDQRAALKVLTIDLKTQPGLFQRFINEARAANQIKHPGVVNVYDFGQCEDGTPWMAMEFLEGASLASQMESALLKPGHAMGLDGLWIVGELASVLYAAHQKGIVHRDLKPQNIMLVPDPRSLHGDVVKLLDFGIAKLHGDDLTKSNVILGTPSYMAPEQFKNASEVDGRADVYALGIIAYQILCGRLPFSAEGAYGQMAAKCFDAPTPLLQYAPSLTADVAALVMAMLEREPERRPELLFIEAEVRRILGLPTPRRGSHQEVRKAPPNPPAPPPRTEDLDPTPSLAGVPADSVEALRAAVAPTPSGEKAAGELSPPHLAVPDSLSSMPSVPMSVAPPVRVVPNARTAQALPAPLPPPVKLASPTAETSPDGAAKPRRTYWLAALGSFGLLSAFAALFWQMQPVAKPPGGAEPAAIAASDLAVAAAPAAPEDLAVPQDLTPLADFSHATPTVQSGRSCEPHEVTEQCILTPLSPAHRRQILTSFRSTGVKLCAGERMVVSDLKTRPYLRVAPPSLRANLQTPLLYALRGLLKGDDTPKEVELKCHGH